MQSRPLKGTSEVASQPYTKSAIHYADQTVGALRKLLMLIGRCIRAYYYRINDFHHAEP